MENKFQKKKAQVEVLEKLDSYLTNMERDIKQVYCKVGETDEQETHWKTGELLWKDEEKTIPKMKAVYDYVDRPEEEIYPEDKLKLEVIKDVRNYLEKLL